MVPGGDVAICEYRSAHYGDAIRISRTRALPVVESDAGLPDPRACRSMSRTGVLLSLVCLRSALALEPALEADPFSVGVYCAVENGPVDFAAVREMSTVPSERFAERYRKLFNPKMHLRQLPNLVAAQAGIFLGIQGPMHVFNNSLHGSAQALEQAEIDLCNHRVAAALVCSAFSFENPLAMERLRRTVLGARVLCEGAGALLLAGNASETRWDEVGYDQTEEFFGISHQLIVQIARMKGEAEDGRRA